MKVPSRAEAPLWTGPILVSLAPMSTDSMEAHRADIPQFPSLRCTNTHKQDITVSHFQPYSSIFRRSARFLLTPPHYKDFWSSFGWNRLLMLQNIHTTVVTRISRYAKMRNLS